MQKVNRRLTRMLPSQCVRVIIFTAIATYLIYSAFYVKDTKKLHEPYVKQKINRTVTAKTVQKPSIDLRTNRKPHSSESANATLPISGKPFFNASQQQQSLLQFYDRQITGLDRARLGFAVDPEFQILPEYRQNLLGYTSNTSDRRKTFKKILIYHKTEWLNFTECPHYPTQHFNCEFMFWDDIKYSNKSLTLTDFILENDIDAIFKHQDNNRMNNIQPAIDLVDKRIRHRNINRSESIQFKIPKVIYFTWESPYSPNSFRFQANPRFKNGSRDYLATYWRGSDIYLPYFRWKYFNEDVTTKSQARNFAEGRTKGAAIVVSNCDGNNGRLKLVKELQKYFPVDIYGQCGTFKCPTDGCFTNITKTYKFYLAFENSNCRDYITEKLFRNAYKNDLLPIVFGAHPSDYRAIAPANSYIHIENFETIEKLAQYLHLVNTNDTLYNEYFLWKGTGELISFNLLCEICAFEHRDSFDFKGNSVLNSKTSQEVLPYFNDKDSYAFQIFNWSSSEKRLCLPNNKWYWNK